MTTRTPKRVEVRYRASEQPQRVTVTVGVVPIAPVHNLPLLVRRKGNVLQRLGLHGLLGSDLFDPTECRVEELSCTVTESGGTFEVVSVLRVQGVAPAGLALAVRTMVRVPRELQLSALVVEGELAPNGDARSVDTARALRWFGDVDVDAMQPPRDLRFPVFAKPKKNTFAVVELAPGAWRTIGQAFTELDTETLGARGSDDDEPTAVEDLQIKPGETKAEIVIKRHYVPPGATVPDRTLARTMVLHAAANAGVTSLRWCDDAQVVDAPPPPLEIKAKAPPKKKRPKIVHPDLGPSRIGEVRRAFLERDEAPWAEGATSGDTVPEKLDGAPTPPTFRAWLSYFDATWPLPREAAPATVSFHELLGPRTQAFAPLEALLFPGACVPLFVPSLCSDGTVLFLYLPFANDDGEAPVLGLDPSDDGLVGVFAPRFDHYLARALGIDPQPWSFGPLPGTAPYLEALVAQLPARVRAQLLVENGVLFVGPLVF